MIAVSNVCVRMRWRSILCFWGLTLFGLVTLGSMQMSSLVRNHHQHTRYFWWGTMRLDSDPLNRHSEPCIDAVEGDCFLDPEYIWVTPGWAERALVLSAMPAMLLAIPIVRGLAHFGVSEFLSFMVTMPFLILAWFYAVGYLLDRWRWNRSLRRQPVSP